MKYNFNYLIERIKRSEFSSEPFKHIYLEDFFKKDHFDEIIHTGEVSIPPTFSDEELFDILFARGYKIISFPGCVTDKSKYLEWHNGQKSESLHTACEGFGVTLRLYEPSSDILRYLKDFLESEAFNKCIAEKFSVTYEDCTVDCGIQKYLDGYEISPHPDIRRKAATFLVNINPGKNSELDSHHTQYLKFKPERKYVQSFWEGNFKIDRCWVPWTWTEKIFQQVKNNSVVLFSPSDNTLHGVKADYDHLQAQRTQLYGNLWFKENKTIGSLEWESLDLLSHKNIGMKSSIRSRVRNALPTPIANFIRKSLQFRANGKIGRRDY